jgi:hypothetical protein
MYSYCRHFILFKLFRVRYFWVERGCKKCIEYVSVKFARKAIAHLTYDLLKIKSGKKFCLIFFNFQRVGGF